MHKVTKAIIMAAGKGERLRPVTDTTPKPLVKVNGISMIETVISALRKNGIFDICVVTGYKKEQFSYLPKKYSGLTLTENPDFETCNNISSLYAAKDVLSGGDCMIIDGDQLIFDPGALSPFFTRSGYNTVFTEKETTEWLLQVKDGLVVSASRTGGKKGHQLYGISRWTKEDAEKLKNLLVFEFEKKKNTSVYWDDIALFLHPEDFSLGIFPMNASAVLEIDSFAELVQEDPSYSEL